MENRVIPNRFQFLFLFLIITGAAFAQKTSTPQVQNFMQNKQFCFIENKGQLNSPRHSGPGPESPNNSNIQYYGKDNGVNIYCENNKISFVFMKTEGVAPQASAKQKLSPAGGGRGWKPDLTIPNRSGWPNLSASRLEMLFTNANPSPTITPSDKQEYYENYYTTGDANHGILSVHTYKTITYQNIYPHIDLILKAGNKSLEYSFLVHPGGNVADIQIKWKGADSIKELENGRISYALPPFGTSVGATGGSPNNVGQNGKQGDRPVAPTMTESEPTCYQTTAGAQNIVPLQTTRSATHLSFSIPTYDKTKDLLIDPTLDWGTYFGGSQDDYGYGITHDAGNNIYITGWTQSDSGIATSGSHQTSFGWNDDAFIAKFNPSGAMIWSTYYGGSNGDYGYAIAADDSNNIYITGSTGSSSGIVTSGAYQTQYAGGGDAFVAKFDSSGLLSWGTYFGGNYWDQGFAITTDANNDVYITGETSSTKGIATSGAHLTSLALGSTTCFIAKFTSYGGLSWGTYYGHSGADAGEGIAADANNNVYITGYTYSGSGIATPYAHQINLSGLSDAFLAKFTPSGKLSWGTYYGGENSEGHGVTIDRNNNVYITGSTQSSGRIATAGTSQPVYAGGGDAFLAKFTSSGSLSWGTYYGGKGEDIGYSTAADTENNIYLTGYTTSSGGIATMGAYKTGNAGGGDAFVAKFNIFGGLEWGTYYGGTGEDEAFAITAASNFNIYITGITGSISQIATSGAFKTSMDTINSDAFVAKFDLPPPNNDAGIVSIPTSIACSNVPSLKVQLQNFGRDTLKSVKINWKLNSLTQTAYYWTGSLKTNNSLTVNIGSFTLPLGQDTLVIWTSKPNGAFDSVPGNDTFREIFFVNLSPSVNAGIGKTICSGNTDTIGANAISGYSYNWTANPAGFGSSNSNPYVTPTSTTTYYLTVTSSSYCQSYDSVIVTVNPSPAALAGNNKVICSGDSALIGAAGVTGDTYSWKSNPPGDSSALSTFKVAPLITTIYYVTEIVKATGCSNSNSVTINVLPAPDPHFSVTSTYGGSFNFSANDKKESTYNWDFGDKTTGTGDLITHTYVYNNPYKVSLVVNGTNNCTASWDTTIIVTTSIEKTTPTSNLHLTIYPNPFSAVTNISYTLPAASNVQVSVTDMDGRLVATLNNGPQSPGSYTIPFDAAKYNCARGVYFMKMVVDNAVIVRQIVRME